MKTNVFLILLSICIPLWWMNAACTKLTTTVHDQISNFWQDSAQVAAGVGAAYSGLRSYAPGFPQGVYELSEVCTDEIIVPDRLINWNDGFIWKTMWQHTWTPDHPFLQTAWSYIYGGIARINGILQAFQKLSLKPGEKDALEAELKTLRAFYYYQGIDFFGNIPIYEAGVTESAKLGTRSRVEVYSYIEKELQDNLSKLPSDANQKTYGRATKWLAYAILGKLYLNAEVYTSKPRWTECIAACAAILKAGIYTLEPDFFTNFLVANEISKENIFVLPFDRVKGADFFTIQLFTLHPNSYKTFNLMSDGANGYCSTAEYYNLFKPDDKRRNMFLVGQQYAGEDPTHPQVDNANQPLSFDPVITSFVIQPPKTETAGARCHKWQFNKEGWGNMSNDFAVYRLADIILMKAEAQFRSGDIAGALVTINQKINGVSIRSRADLADFDISELNPDGLLAERARELSWEGFRRNDMIRFGHFTDARIPEKTVSESFRNLYPIPGAELDKNLYLKQNPGY